MIRDFSVKNFRNVNIDNIAFNKINILIGPNNSGKTNFIKALSFFSNMIIAGKDNIHESSFLSEVDKNGWDKLLNKYASSTEVEFDWTIDLDGEECKYSFAFNAGNQPENFFITKEELSMATKPIWEQRPFNYFKCHTEAKGICVFSTAKKKGQPNKRVTMPVSNKDTVLFQFKDTLYDKPEIDKEKIIRTEFTPKFEQLRKYFKASCSYSSSQFNLGLIRQPSDSKVKGLLLLKDASNFANVFNYYKTKDIYFKIKFEEKLKELMPSITTTDLTLEFDKLVFRLAYDYKQYDLNDISDGTIKAIILLLLLLLPENESYLSLALDEPEMNLHPAWQKVIGKWIQTMSGDRQYFISTHSPDLLDVFTDGFRENQVGVFVFDLRQEQQITKLTYGNIRDELGNWQLGDLYRTNDPAIGGWPW